MTEEDGLLGLLYSQLEEEKTALTAAIVSGGAKDFAEYREMSGRVHGLARAQSRINEMVDRLRRQQE